MNIRKYGGYYGPGEPPELPNPCTPEGLTAAMRACMPELMQASFCALYNAFMAEKMDEEAAFGLTMEAMYCLGWMRGADGSFARTTIEKGAEDVAKAGRVLSAANEAKLRAAMDAMMSVLDAAMPKPKEEPAADVGKSRIIKIDDARRTALGWTSVTTDADGNEVRDLQGHRIPMENLHKAMAEYITESREWGSDHEGGCTAEAIGGLVIDDDVAKALGMVSKIRGAVVERRYLDTPEGEAAYQKVKKSGGMASIFGTATLVDE